MDNPQKQQNKIVRLQKKATYIIYTISFPKKDENCVV